MDLAKSFEPRAIDGERKPTFYSRVFPSLFQHALLQSRLNRLRQPGTGFRQGLGEAAVAVPHPPVAMGVVQEFRAVLEAMSKRLTFANVH